MVRTSVGNMRLNSNVAALAAVLLACPIAAQYFPPAPENLTVVNSGFDGGISISFKEVSHLHTRAAAELERTLFVSLIRADIPPLTFN